MHDPITLMLSLHDVSVSLMLERPKVLCLTSDHNTHESTSYNKGKSLSPFESSSYNKQSSSLMMIRDSLRSAQSEF